MSDTCNNQNTPGMPDLSNIKIKRAGRAGDCEQPHAGSKIRKVIGVVSGKGGVGKSLVTSLLAVNMNAHGFKTAILDADITGPSIPRAFGLSGQPVADEEAMYPIMSKEGIAVMSTNFLLQEETDPVIWRGPVIASAVTQFWKDVIWGNIEYMFIDMPPGTGDVALTVFQSIPIDGIIVVTSPQELVSMIVEKAVKMAEKMSIPILGLIENMSYTECPHCGEHFSVFGESHIEEIAEKYGVKCISKLPFSRELAELCDSGRIESFTEDNLHSTIKMLRNIY